MGSTQRHEFVRRRFSSTLVLASSVLASSCHLVSSKPEVVTGAASDAQVDVTVDAKVDADDGSAGDVSPDTRAACPAVSGCDCEVASECASGLCVQTGDGGRCTDVCADGECPKGWSCEGQKGGVDGALFCIPDAGLLCRPCETHDACRASGHATAACVDYGDGGAFCGVPCAGDADCPAGNVCRDAKGIEGGPVKQCVVAGAGPTGLGVCDCPTVSAAKGHTTLCWLTDGQGVQQRRCKGRRICGPDGLGACTALTGAQASCVDLQCLDALTGLPIADGKGCDDSRGCTAGDTCKAGTCQSGTQVCACEPGFKSCAAPTGAALGNKCLGSLYCAAAPASASVPFACVPNPGDTIVCDSAQDSACIKNACVPLSGACTATAIERTVELCDLQPGADGKPGCRREVTAASAPDAAPLACDDGLSCSLSDTCAKGSCTGDAQPCKCKKDVDCAYDQNLCNGTAYCDKSGPTWACKVNPATVVVCDGSSDVGCQQTSCQPSTGACKQGPVPVGKPCSDGVACTIGDVCDSTGQCQPGTVTCCKADADCASKEDGDACNGTLFCDKAEGACKLNLATVVSCPTADDTVCSKAACAKVTGKCGQVPVAGKALCDDGDACTDGDVCTLGACVGGTDTCICASDADCVSKDDGDLCNGTLYCNKAIGKCKANPATVVVCPTVDDGPCKRNLCQVKSGKCAMTALAAATTCDADGTGCTVNDICDDKGGCQPGKLICPCLADGDCAGFEDGNVCNGTLYCDKTGLEPACKLNLATVKVCKSVDDTACVKNLCQPKTGVCESSPLPAGAACDDGQVCTGGDSCSKEGTCTSGVQPLCGCKSNSDCADFDDSDVCNGAFACKNAACVYDGKILLCDDKSPCTKDSCHPEKGCQHVPLAGCATCTEDKTCDDGNICTYDFCLTGQCKWPGATLGCDDGSACTVGDACAEGVCKSGAAKLCDDKEAYTNDSCDPATGCVNKPANNLCSDGDACTTGETCNNGACNGTLQTVKCDDKKPCTADSCDMVKGCVNDSGKVDGQTCNEIAGGGMCKAAQCVLFYCVAGFSKVSINDNGNAKHVCEAQGPAWGNRPSKPTGVFAVQDVAGEKVVVDSQTTLMWQQTAAVATAIWTAAKSQCDGLVYAGYKDWRLPSAHEAATLVDFSAPSPGPAIDLSAFPGLKGAAFWSSTSQVQEPLNAWTLSFITARVLVGKAADPLNVRCVRGTAAQPVGERYQVSAGGVVTDAWTQLQWQQAVATPSLKWSAASTYCSNLDLEGGGWRLPWVRELHSLVDYQATPSCIDLNVFANTAAAPFWSASLRTANSLLAWNVDFRYGSVVDQSVDKPLEVRCVRGN